MTFSLVARCAETGMFGVAISSSSGMTNSFSNKSADCFLFAEGSAASNSFSKVSEGIRSLSTDVMRPSCAGSSGGSWAIVVVDDDDATLACRLALVGVGSNSFSQVSWGTLPLSVEVRRETGVRGGCCGVASNSFSQTSPVLVGKLESVDTVRESCRGVGLVSNSFSHLSERGNESVDEVVSFKIPTPLNHGSCLMYRRVSRQFEVCA